jgi:hypothetical protein
MHSTLIRFMFNLPNGTNAVAVRSRVAAAIQQILAGDIEDEAVGAGEIGRGDFASGGIPEENNSCPMIVKGRKKRWDVRFSLVVP